MQRISFLSARTIIASLFALTAGTAQAADMPVKAPPVPVAVAAYNWTGFYIGGHGGWAWTGKEWRLPTGQELVRYTADDGIYGVQGGFNWQTGNWVLGVEAQTSWGEIRTGRPHIEQDNIVGPSGRVTRGRVGTTVEHFGSVALRLGHAFDRSLIYVKGGAAWAHDVYRAFNLDAPGEPLLASATDTRWGGMVGVGYECAFLGNWSAKIEFDYHYFGDERVTLVAVPGVTPTSRQFDVRQDISVVKAGINYRFGAR